MTTPKITKIPRGTVKSPWYFVPEHKEGNKVITACFVRYTKQGVQVANQVPPNAIVKTDTSY